MYPVITISREFGSGGHSIGKAVAEALDIPFYDTEIMQMVAQESGYTEEFIQEQGEYATGADKWFVANTFYSGYFSGPQDEIYRIQSKIVVDMAKKGPCVIVGRCADYLLDKFEIPALNVFIHASQEHREKRILERYGETDVPIEKRLEKKDKGRKTYYRYYTDRTWGDYSNYHLNLDSGYLGEATCVEIITSIAKAKSEEDK